MRCLLLLLALLLSGCSAMEDYFLDDFHDYDYYPSGETIIHPGSQVAQPSPITQTSGGQTPTPTREPELLQPSK